MPNRFAPRKIRALTYVTHQELVEAKSRAAGKELSLSDYIRSLILADLNNKTVENGQPTKPPTNPLSDFIFGSTEEPTND